MDVNSITLLKNLFDQCHEENENSSDSENELNSNSSNLGNKKKAEIKNTIENSLLQKIDTQGDYLNSIEEWDEQQKKDEELLDFRKAPEYKISYKQVVTTEDIYLQMGFKTPATSSCEDMVVEIQLPEEVVGIDQMDLNVTENEVQLKSPVYKLKLSLPQKVHPSKGRAEYDADKKMLKLTIRMNREYDFVNF